MPDNIRVISAVSGLCIEHHEQLQSAAGRPFVFLDRFPVREATTQTKKEVAPGKVTKPRGRPPSRDPEEDLPKDLLDEFNLPEEDDFDPADDIDINPYLKAPAPVKSPEEKKKEKAALPVHSPAFKRQAEKPASGPSTSPAPHPWRATPPPLRPAPVVHSQPVVAKPPDPKPLTPKPSLPEQVLAERSESLRKLRDLRNFLSSNTTPSAGVLVEGDDE